MRSRKKRIFKNWNTNISFNYILSSDTYITRKLHNQKSILFLKWQLQKKNVFLDHSDFVRQTKDKVV